MIFGHNIEAGDTFGVFTPDHRDSNSAQGLWDAAKREYVPGMIEAVEALRMGSLRYPGGCLVHNFNWKAAVGPLPERPNFQFGIDEWIQLCRRLGAEPVYTVADYYGTSQETAELVEYLNAPAIPKHPWAMKRAEWGHPEPYKVKWFELGNESDHGNHSCKPPRKFTPQEYSDWAKEYAQKMRAVDPAIKIGINTPPGDGRYPEEPWNQVVFREAGPIADFVVVHFYAPAASFWKELTPEETQALNEACMATNDQLSYRIRQYKEAIKKYCGRELPLAITEYNAMTANIKSPVPYRFSFAPALQSADFIRLCLEPEHQNDINMAQYWQIANGHWGALRDGGKVVHPAYPLFRLWGGHVGKTLLTTTVQTPSASFGGFRGVDTAKGDSYLQPGMGRVTLPGRLPETNFNKPGVSMVPTEEGFIVNFDGYNAEGYPTLCFLKNSSDLHYGMRYNVRFEGRMKLTPALGQSEDIGHFGIGIEDSRGWGKVQSAVAISGVEKATEWQKFQGTFLTRPDARGVRLSVRLIAKKAISGTMEIRNLVVETPLPETFPAYPLLSSTATRSADGKSVYLIVFNKSLNQFIKTSIDLAGFKGRSASFRQITGTPESIATPEENSGKLDLQKEGSLIHTFPPSSMTAITINQW